MKKQIIAVALGLSMVALPVFAHGNEKQKASEHANMEKGRKLGIFKNLGDNILDTQFVVVGSVTTVGTNTFTVKATALAHVANITNSLVTIKTDANTKISTPVAVGQNVVVFGNVSGTDLLASNVRLVNSSENKKEEAKKSMVMGKVTAKTGNSITITNTLTNTSKTITTNTDTTVKIDGETKTLADINVGDSGWIKFKTMGTDLIAKVIHLFR
ncbi:MAG: hypothetical protein KW788_01615 [Candidatus Doudnabacteria bacterium]|nr:hypothetical protein [Candidatus Doudnabacteria bacterium]